MLFIDKFKIGNVECFSSEADALLGGLEALLTFDHIRDSIVFNDVGTAVDRLEDATAITVGVFADDVVVVGTRQAVFRNGSDDSSRDDQTQKEECKVLHFFFF